MASWTIAGPDGASYTVDGPDDTPDEVVLENFTKQFPTGQATGRQLVRSALGVGPKIVETLSPPIDDPANYDSKDYKAKQVEDPHVAASKAENKLGVWGKVGKVATETAGALTEVVDMAASLPHMLARPAISIAGALTGKSQKEIQEFNQQFATPVKNILKSLGVDGSLLTNKIVQDVMKVIDEKGFDPAAEVMGNMLNIDLEANPESKDLLKNSLMLGLAPVIEGAKALKPTPKVKPSITPKVDVKVALDEYIKENSPEAPPKPRIKLKSTPEQISPVESVKVPGHEGGWIEIGGLLDYTGAGFRDAMDSAKEASKKTLEVISRTAPTIANRIKDSAFKEPDNTPTPLFHGTRTLKQTIHTPTDQLVGSTYKLTNHDVPFEALKTGSDGLIHVGTAEAANMIGSHIYSNGFAGARHGVPDFPNLYKYAYDKLLESPDFANLPKEKVVASVEKFLDTSEGSAVFRKAYLDDYQTYIKRVLETNKDSPAKDTLKYRLEAPLGKHLRPLWVEAKNPLMVRDLGGWFPPEWREFLLDDKPGDNTAQSGVGVVSFKDQLKATGKTDAEISFFLDRVNEIKKIPDVFRLLEEAGFDSLVYPNAVENARQGLTNLKHELGIKFDGFGEQTQPSFSVAVWKPEQIHEWLNLPKTPKPFPMKGEAGYIDIGAIYKGFNDFFKERKDKVKVYREDMLNRYVPKYANLKESLQAALNGEKNTDIGILQRDLDVGQQSKNKQLNHVMTSGYWNIRNIDFETIKLYKEQVQDVVSKVFDNIDKDSQIKITEVMTSLQKPSVQQFIANQPNKVAPDAMLAKMGLSPKEIEVVKQLRPLMETIKKLENDASTKLRGKPLTSSIVDYWPTATGGKFMLMATHPDGTFDIKGFSTIKELAQVEREALKDIADKKSGVKLERVMPDQKTSVFDELYMASMVMEAVDKATGRPKEHTLSAIAQKMEEAREQYKRTFEMARTKQDMTDYLSNFITQKSKGERLLDAFHNRLFQSFQFYKNSRIIDEVLRPLGDENFKSYLNAELPNTFYDLRNRAAREAGINISAGQELGRTIDKAVNSAAILKENMLGRKVSSNDFIIKPSSFKRSVAYANSFSTTMALALKPLFLAQQAVTAFTMPVTMFRELAPFKFNSAQLGAANLQATLKTGPSVFKFAHDFVTKKTSAKPTGVEAFLLDAYDKGWISAHLWDDLMPGFTSRTARGQGPVTAALGKIRKGSVDKIEGVTNVNSLAYYYHAVEALFPEITKEKHYQLAYDLAKSHTGEYKKYNQPLAYERYTGQIGGQFQTWTHNLLGKNVQELQLAGKGDLRPLMYGLAAAYVLAGLYGMPGVVEYETFRSIYDKHKAADAMPLPPLDIMMEEMGIPYELRQAQLMDRLSPWSMDLATSMRYSSFLEMRLLAADWGINAVKAMNTLRKEAGLTFEGEPVGVTTADRAAMGGAMPQGLPFTPLKMRTAVFDTNQAGDPTGKGYIVNKYGQRNYSFDTTEELILNSLGIKNQRQRKELKSREVERYFSMKDDREQKKMALTIVDQAMNGDVASMEQNLTTYVTKFAPGEDADTFISSLDAKIAEAALKRSMTLEQMRLLQAAKATTVSSLLKNKRIQEKSDAVLK